MLGVIGIHVGSFYLQNPHANIYLVALYEIATRFSVPIFFFISAFGLLYNLDVNKPFNYLDFLKRRSISLMLPYLTWSLVYVAHDFRLYHMPFPEPGHLAAMLFFGNGKYQLYFMVILFWFYILIPIFIKLIRTMTLAKLAVFLILQLIFNYWSSFSTDLNVFIYSLPEDSPLRLLLYYRLNYWPMHYAFVFVLGGYLATRWEIFLLYIRYKFPHITLFFLVSLGAILSYYYRLLTADGLTPLEAVNTAHQLSPTGIFYTIGASLFLFALFTNAKKLNFPGLNSFFGFLGKHSYFCYLAHPMTITYLAKFLTASGLVMTAWLSIGFYTATLILTLLAAIIFRAISQKISIIGLLTIGTRQPK